MPYLCKYTFVSDAGDYYLEGSTITRYEYDTLNEGEQNFFLREHEPFGGSGGDEPQWRDN